MRHRCRFLEQYYETADVLVLVPWEKSQQGLGALLNWGLDSKTIWKGLSKGLGAVVDVASGRAPPAVLQARADPYRRFDLV